ncbi:MAG TPA: AgmX/PglI C-terminal domain-containing protein, partial [Anaeromyxobacteraceae bacterium]|nr:AgmX/PglI C-terminal domain-containing protein [Anaeromyxobacteraceae bacterium]
EQKPAPVPEKPAVAEPKPAAPEPKRVLRQAQDDRVGAATQRPARTEPSRTVRREPARAPVREPARQPERIAAQPAPAAAREPARSGGLDFGGSDDALEAALGGGGGSGRSVYVPPRPGGTSGLSASLSPAQINEAVAGRVDSLRRCVSEQKAREPDASGVIKMQWTIVADGSPRNVRCVTPEYAKSQFAACIGNVVKGIRFPRSATTGQEVTFPFSF